MINLCSQEFSACFICSKWLAVVDYISYNNGNKCQLMMPLLNQFIKRADFWSISISISIMIMVIPKPNFMFFWYFWQIFFTILFMTIFNFQFWVNPLSATPIKWSNTLKKFVGKLPTNFLIVFDHFVILALKGLR